MFQRLAKYGDVFSLVRVSQEKKKYESGPKGGSSQGLSDANANGLAEGGFEVVCTVLQRCTVTMLYVVGPRAGRASAVKVSEGCGYGRLDEAQEKEMNGSDQRGACTVTAEWDGRPAISRYHQGRQGKGLLIAAKISEASTIENRARLRRTQVDLSIFSFSPCSSPTA